jgi:hypothetical protein
MRVRGAPALEPVDARQGQTVRPFWRFLEHLLTRSRSLKVRDLPCWDTRCSELFSAPAARTKHTTKHHKDLAACPEFDRHHSDVRREEFAEARRHTAADQAVAAGARASISNSGLGKAKASALPKTERGRVRAGANAKESLLAAPPAPAVAARRLSARAASGRAQMDIRNLIHSLPPELAHAGDGVGPPSTRSALAPLEMSVTGRSGMTAPPLAAVSSAGRSAPASAVSTAPPFSFGSDALRSSSSATTASLGCAWAGDAEVACAHVLLGLTSAASGSRASSAYSPHARALAQPALEHPYAPAQPPTAHAHVPGRTHWQRLSDFDDEVDAYERSHVPPPPPAVPFTRRADSPAPGWAVRSRGGSPAQRVPARWDVPSYPGAPAARAYALPSFAAFATLPRRGQPSIAAWLASGKHAHYTESAAREE